MRIITEKALQKMIKEAYMTGLNVRDKIDNQTKRMDEHNRGIIMSGYNMEKDLQEIMERKGCN